MMDSARFAALMRKRGRVLETVVAQRVQRAAAVIQGSYEHRLRAVTGDMRMSGTGRGGRKVGARKVLRRNGFEAIVSARGPAHLLEGPTSPHLITSRKGGSRAARARRLGGMAWSARTGAASLPVGPVYARGRARGVVVIPGVGPRVFARHPGTRGKMLWHNALRTSVPRARRILGERVVDSLPKGV